MKCHNTLPNGLIELVDVKVDAIHPHIVQALDSSGYMPRVAASRALTGLLTLLLSMGSCGDFRIPAAEAMSSMVRTSASAAFARPLLAVPPSSQSLSGEWRFAVDPSATGQAAGWFEPSFDDASWPAVKVPHTWNVMPDYANYAGLAWYRRRFIPLNTTPDAHVRLRFEAVFYLAHVWVNGKYLGEHEGGYAQFEFDVSGLVEPGRENVIAVQVDNVRATNRLPATLQPTWSFDWWNYGGIVRDVSLQLTSRAFIVRQRIIAVPHLVAAHEADVATITAVVTVQNTSTEAVDGVLTGDVRDDPSGLSVLSTQPTSPVALSPGERADIQLSTTISRPELWHFDHPHLYHWWVSLRTANGWALHTATVSFGVRTIELKHAQLYLNGEPVRLVGLSRHADSPEHGLAETMTVMAADYADLKTLNMVLSRPAHYPQADFILDYADRTGILLIPEVPAWQLSATQMNDPHMRELERQQLREMIMSQWNHPSVWAWSVGNEFESKTQAGHAFTHEMIAYVKSLDPTRPVGFASNLLNESPEADTTTYADFVLFNQYFGTWSGPEDQLGSALDAIHATWRDKPIIISEFGFEPRWQRFVKWPIFFPSRYYLIPDDVPADGEAADIQRRRLIGEQMAVLRTKPFVAGAIFWTYQDYRTPTNYQMGVVDAHRRRRGSWSVLREEYAPVLINSMTFSPGPTGIQEAVVVLRTRGPIDRDMPAYTLSGYRLQWVVTGVRTLKALSQGDLPLPTLVPGATWQTQVEWWVPTEDYIFTLRIMRPTGFTVLERSYDAQGRPR